jgi:hypothetical protein
MIQSRADIAGGKYLILSIFTEIFLPIKKLDKNTQF